MPADNKQESGKRVVSNSIIYTVSGLMLKCFSFFLLPLYTAYLTTEDYGIQSVATSFMSTMVFVVAFSLFSAVWRFYVDLKHDETTLRRFYGSVVLFVFASSIAFGLLLFLFRGLVVRYVFNGVAFYPVVLICIVTLVFNCQQQIYVSILRSRQEALKCSVLSIAYFFVTLGFNILFVVFRRMGAVGVLLSLLISNFVYTAYFIFDMLRAKSIVFCFDRRLLKEALAYSVPILPHNLATKLAQLISKVLIGGTGTLSLLGLFTVASQFGDIADTIQTYVNHAYGPWLFERLHSRSEGYKKTIRSVVRALCGVLGLFFVCLALFSHDYIVLFINSKYIESWKYVPLVVLVYGIKTMYYFYVNILFYYKKASRIIFTATLSGSLVNILTSAVFIPLWGVYGSIVADAIAMLVRVVIVYVISKHFEDIGLKASDFGINFIIIAAFIFAGLAPSYLFFSDKFSLINFGYKLLVIGVYCAYLYAAYRKQLKPIISKIKNRRSKRS
ncbi:MAG: oligosaccharide flippase family protein [Abditibacteriota bacterium]|nr:oligosaccharide flippase family protein [Abditibacteriota bacterium]